MTDYKQLCAELVEDLALWLEYDGPPSRLPETEDESYQLFQRARAALAQPEPKGPTDEELDLLADCHMITDGETGAVSLEHLDYARAVLKRWGCSTPRPAAGEVTELVDLIRQNVALAWEPAACMLGNMTAGELTRAAELLEQLNPPQPVPVSERLPGPEDCDAEGLCWVWNSTAYTWGMFQLDLTAHSHWLPSHALPQPS